jgi:hypothetical protein
MPPLFRVITAMMRPFFLNPEKGAEPGLFLATSDKMNKNQRQVLQALQGDISKRIIK